MIRQAISCDICATEKKQTNHWFVVYEQGGELRVSGWNSRNRLRPGSKHLCGQTCLHKLVDEFMATSIAQRQPSDSSRKSGALEEPALLDTSLTSAAAYPEVESSARLVAAVKPVPAAVIKPSAELISIQPARTAPEASALPEEPPRFASRNWRDEAWKRERERELRAVDGRPANARRRSNG